MFYLGAVLIQIFTTFNTLKTVACMKNPSKALVNNTQEFNFTEDVIENLNVADLGNDSFHILSENKSIVAEIVSFDFFKRTSSIKINSKVYEVEIEPPLQDIIKKMGYRTGSSKKVNSVNAPMPGIIIDIQVKKGQEVKEGDVLLVLEAMKMENSILSPKDAVIKDILVDIGNTVDKNKLLIDFE